MGTEGSELPEEEEFELLLVEPDSALSENIKNFLEDENEILNVVDSEGSPEKGLDFIRDSDFDAVLSEVDFSNYDAVEYLEEIREIKPNLPIVIFSNNTDEKMILNSLNHHVNYYLLKDSDPKSKLEEVYGVLVEVIREKWEREKEESLHADLRHDLRNKLQIVQGYLELMEDDELTEDQEEFLKKSMDNLREGAELIEDVRSFRRNKL